MRIYISGPITGTENYLEHFKAAEDYWTSKGFSCINPAALDTVLPKDLSYEEHMDIDMHLMDMCDTIYLLKGWENSRGANREYGYALGKEFTIIKEYDELDPPKQGMPNPLENKMPDSNNKMPNSANDKTKEKTGSGGATPRKKIDIGKVMALRNAGWSNIKIADEMGVKPQSIAAAVYNYKKEQEETSRIGGLTCRKRKN